MDIDINERIKHARLEAGKTQQDLATHLGKTAASISDIERGKVQVSANELFEIAMFFRKPIEFFYGVELEQDLSDIVKSAVQYSDATELDELLTILNYTRKIKKFSKYANKKYGNLENQQLDHEDMMEFYEIILPYFQLLDKYRSEAREMKLKLEKAMKLVD